MKTEVSSDRPITDATLGSVASAVETGLSRFAERLTRAEVHLKHSGSGDVDCTLETRPAGRNPVVVKDQSASLDEAVCGAVEKMCQLLETTFGKSDSHRGPSASGQPT